MWNKNTSKRHCLKQHRKIRLYKFCLLRFLPEVFWGECFWSNLQHWPLVSFSPEGGVGASKLLPSICTVRFLTLTFSYLCKAGYSKCYNGPSVVLKGGEERSRVCSHTVSHPHSHSLLLPGAMNSHIRNDREVTVSTTTVLALYSGRITWISSRAQHNLYFFLIHQNNKN